MAAKIKCPYPYSARSREAKIDFICGIGGYRNRDGRWPIEFNVALDRYTLSFEHLWGAYRTEYANPRPDEDVGEFKRVAQMAYARIGEGSLYSVAQEDCCRDLDKDWTDTYYSLWDGKSIHATLSLRGRCGKHLVLDTFFGLRLEGLDADDLFETLTAQHRDGEDITGLHRLRRGFQWYYDADYIDLLYKYCVQCSVDFTPKKASLNLENYAASYLFSAAEADYETYVKNKADHAAVVGCAQTLRRYLAEHEGSAVLQMLRTLSEAAGVSEEELWQGE